MLVPWAVLGEEARPGLGVRADDREAPFPVARVYGHAAVGHDGADRRGAFADQVGVDRVERDVQPPDTAWVLEDAAIPEVDAESVGVGPGRK